MELWRVMLSSLFTEMQFLGCACYSQQAVVVDRLLYLDGSSYNTQSSLFLWFLSKKTCHTQTPRTAAFLIEVMNAYVASTFLYSLSWLKLKWDMVPTQHCRQAYQGRQWLWGFQLVVNTTLLWK